MKRRCVGIGPTAAGAAASRATPASARYHDALALVLLFLRSTPDRGSDILAIKTTTLARRTRKLTALRWQPTFGAFSRPTLHARRCIRPAAGSDRFLCARQPSSRSSGSHCSPTIPAARQPTESALSSPSPSETVDILDQNFEVGSRTTTAPQPIALPDSRRMPLTLHRATHAPRRLLSRRHKLALSQHIQVHAAAECCLLSSHSKRSKNSNPSQNNARPRTHAKTGIFKTSEDDSQTAM